MRTALEKLLDAIRLEDENIELYRIDDFMFRYKNCRIGYPGPYYAYVVEDGTPGEYEYGWENYDDMLDGMIEETGKTMRQMLSELNENDIRIDLGLTYAPGESGMPEPWKTDGEWVLVKQEYFSVDRIEGVKVLRKDGDKVGRLPLYANTSPAYIGITQNGKPVRLRIFNGHYPVKDIDLTRAGNFKAGDPHVHEYDLSNTKNPCRGAIGRSMTAEEERLYGVVLKAMKGYCK